MSLSGKILEGGFELKDLIEADETRAVFRVRVLGDRELVATALFRRLEPAGAERQVELWQTVRELRDVHLNYPLGSGTAELNGSRAAYVVLRQPDESLAGVLRERPLTPAEMKDALLNVAKGLEVLHLNGLVHGNVSPEQIVAIGDTIRLSGEGVRAAGVAPPFEAKPASYAAPETKGVNLTPQADMWSLGATVFETLTQRRWTDSEKETADALPEPFATVALRCLVAEPGGRCHLPELVALVRGEIKPAPRPKPAPVSPPAAATATVLPIDEKQIHAAGVNGSPMAAPASEPKVETIGKRTEEPKPQAAPAPAATTALSAAAAAPNGGAKRESPTAETTAARDRVEARTPVQRPAPVVNKMPASKVQPISEGPAPVPFATGGSRENASLRRDDVDTGERSSKIWIWIWAGVALLAVLFLIWALRPKHATPVAAGPSSATGASASAQTRAGGNAWETKTIQPDGTATSAPAPNEPKTSKNAVNASAPVKSAPKPRTQSSAVTRTTDASTEGESAPSNGKVWRTVLYTYNRQSDAEEKAKALNAQHANLNAEAFSPSGNGGPYLVAVGGRMSREEAIQMRKRVIGLGLPHDSYIQNFKH
ncbi:MAG: protein kinase domain-containing protein [Bryobacteraceae bacterium]